MNYNRGRYMRPRGGRQSHNGNHTGPRGANGHQLPRPVLNNLNGPQQFNIQDQIAAVDYPEAIGSNRGNRGRGRNRPNRGGYSNRGSHNQGNGRGPHGQGIANQGEWRRTNIGGNYDRENGHTSAHPNRGAHNPGVGNKMDDMTNQGERVHTSRGNTKQHRFGYKYIEGLVNNNDIEEVIMVLSRNKDGFVQLMNGDFSNDFIILLVKLLSKLCSCQFRNIIVDVINTTLQSKFIDQLLIYVTQIINQDSKTRNFNKLFWQNPNEFWSNILHISESILGIMPSISCLYVKKILKNMEVYFPSIEKEAPVSEEIKTATVNLLKHAEEIIEEREVKKTSIPIWTNKHDDCDPPDDFRDMSIMPTIAELTTRETPFLRKNIVDRSYNSIEQYLDIQFRLLREDFVSPLRKGICTYLENQCKPKEQKKRLDDIRVHHKVRFLSIEIVNEYNCYKLQLNLDKKRRNFNFENSKRFLYGSLLCFTNDSFATLLVGTIINRDINLLKNGELIVGFEDSVDINYETDYIMVESSIYFEPYNQVLKVFQHMSASDFPMERYIIQIKTDSMPPKYLLKYRAGEKFWALDRPDSPDLSNLNNSQVTAFKAALTQEFCIIQGPPGTGKTHLGLHIARTLLENEYLWYKKTPMLVICFTNHALDQFLEGLLLVTRKILRIGSRSKNESLNEFNIKQKRTRNSFPSDQKRKFMETRNRIKHLSDSLAQVHSNESVISFGLLRNVIDNYRNSWFFSATQEEILAWLLAGQCDERPTKRSRTTVDPEIQNFNEFEIEEDDEEDDNIGIGESLEEAITNLDLGWDDFDFEMSKNPTSHVIHLEYLRNEIRALNLQRTELSQMEYDLWRLVREDQIISEITETQRTELSQREYDLWRLVREEQIISEITETQRTLEYVQWRLKDYGQNPLNRRMPEYIDLENPSRMLPDHRWQLYFYWLDRYAGNLRQAYNDAAVKYRNLYTICNEERELEDVNLMKQNLVIGMTTTGAARLKSSLKALKNPIVIVEEAAEVLEAHIVASLTSHCEHLILIGDHLQLKPGAADYVIEKKYKLGISLFERMVNNQIQCYSLDIQHRMRPEISSLIKPSIYPNLLDHESTLNRPSILGVQKPVFFIDHRESEQVCDDASKKNVHEAKFLIAFARHLILNGYRPEQITILSAYLGQWLEMMKEKKKATNVVLLQNVRICVLDNYQGEESDIILLSLVRNNIDDKIGFLAIQNRVCVALSRARNGFYIMGNMEMLCRAKSENDIWEKVKATLDDQNAIAPFLPLQCQIHPYKISHVTKDVDFLALAEGGCDILCEQILSCGHKCKKLCHVQDRNHEQYHCREKCTRLLCDDPNHVCKKLCHEECGPCCYPVERSLDCGHLVILECYIDPDNAKCQVLVAVELPCNHKADKPCSVDLNAFKCPYPCDTRVEPCGHACSRMCHFRFDPDHLQYQCKQKCSKPRRGCMQTDDPHICQLLCFEDCEECLVKAKKIRSCGHVYGIPCSLDVERDLICHKPCKKKLDCNHPCPNQCSGICGPCTKMIVKVIPECGHKVKMECYRQPERSNCKANECSRLLSCGHKCKNKCAASCTASCKEIVNCNKHSPCGHDNISIPCHLKDTTNPEILRKYCSEPCRAILKCGHECSGTCGLCSQGRIHVKCTEKCGAILVCNHECQTSCREACRPCTRRCEMTCIHSKCKKKCGEPCIECKERCSRICPHRSCKRFCSQICDVPPCTEKCPKILKCSHPCVGFCNDPCPSLCRICDNERLTEIFLGREDEEDAIYIMLIDCGHIFESRDMDDWLASDDGEIKLKVCPRCKTNITKTQRYSEFTKTAMRDVIEVKQRAYGNEDANNRTRLELINELELLNLKCHEYSLLPILRSLKENLQPVKNERRHTLNAMDLNAMKAKIQILNEIVECCGGISFNASDVLMNQKSLLLSVLCRNEIYITNQEREDIYLEITRLERIVQFHKIQTSVHYKCLNGSQKEVLQPLVADIAEKLTLFQRYNSDVEIKMKLEELAAKVSASIKISDRERKEIISALGMGKGHWFRCPNGHLYVITECGGAMQVGKCNECGAQIGGTNHRLLSGQSFASDFDEATAPAWPGVPY